MNEVLVAPGAVNDKFFGLFIQSQSREIDGNLMSDTRTDNDIRMLPR
mgnify:CR=1 FL=1